MLVLASLAACKEAPPSPQPAATTTVASAAAPSASAKLDLQKYIDKLERKREALSKKAPTMRDASEAKKLQEQIHAVDKRLKAVRLLKEKRDGRL